MALMHRLANCQHVVRAARLAAYSHQSPPALHTINPAASMTRYKCDITAVQQLRIYCSYELDQSFIGDPGYLELNLNIFHAGKNCRDVIGAKAFLETSGVHDLLPVAPFAQLQLQLLQALSKPETLQVQQSRVCWPKHTDTHWSCYTQP